MSAAVLDRLLRAPGDIATACREGRDVRAIATASIAAIVLGSAAFGGVVGSYRGGVQIAYAAIKVPLAILVTLAIAAPAFHASAAGFGRPWPMPRVVALALAAAGRSALVLFALTPGVWLLFDIGASYHGAAVIAAMAYAVAGLAALGVLVRGLGEGSGRLLTAAAFVGVFFVVGGQSSWILRPYLLRPRTDEPTFLREREGSFLDAVWTSSRSSVGVYDRDLRQIERERGERR